MACIWGVSRMRMAICQEERRGSDQHVHSLCKHACSGSEEDVQCTSATCNSSRCCRNVPVRNTCLYSVPSQLASESKAFVVFVYLQRFWCWWALGGQRIKAEDRPQNRRSYRCLEARMGRKSELVVNHIYQVPTHCDL